MNELIAWGIAAAVILLLINTNVADGLFDALDLSDNLKRAVDWAQGVRGFPAAVSAFCFFALAYVFGWLAWRYDILPTYRFTQPIAVDVLSTGIDLLGLFAVFLSLVPSFIEVSTSALIKRSIKTLEYLAYFFIFFDLVTDYAEAAALVEIWQRAGLFDPLPPPLAGAAVVLTKISWTFAATFAFEFLTILFGALVLLLAANVGAASVRGGAR